jgi:hypothetical protein
VDVLPAELQAAATLGAAALSRDAPGEFATPLVAVPVCFSIKPAKPSGACDGQILRQLLIADGGEEAALLAVQHATARRRIAHALQHQVQQHALELLAPPAEAGLRIGAQPVAQIAGGGGVEHQALVASVRSFHEAGLGFVLPPAQLR